MNPPMLVPDRLMLRMESAAPTSMVNRNANQYSLRLARPLNRT